MAKFIFKLLVSGLVVVLIASVLIMMFAMTGVPPTTLSMVCLVIISSIFGSYTFLGLGK